MNEGSFLQHRSPADLSEMTGVFCVRSVPHGCMQPSSTCDGAGMVKELSILLKGATRGYCFHCWTAVLEHASPVISNICCWVFIPLIQISISQSPLSFVSTLLPYQLFASAVWLLLLPVHSSYREAHLCSEHGQITDILTLGYYF